MRIRIILSFLLASAVSELLAQTLLTIKNAEVMVVQSGGVLYLEAGLSLDSNATLINAGTITIQPGIFENRGTYTGTGILNAPPFTNLGIVAPGSTMGTLTYQNQFTNYGTLVIEINSASDFDKLIVHDTARAGGILSVNFGNYVPPSNQNFHIIQASQYTGTFAQIRTMPSTISATYNQGILSIAGVLPVKLIDLSAQKRGEMVQLNWRTAFETNNLGFEIQRSRDGQKWEVLHFEAGQGTSSEVQQYTFLDQWPYHGINYYRLRQVDLDGKSELSKVVSEIIWSQRGLTAFPNPMRQGEDLTLSWSAPLGEKMNVHLYNSSGQLLRLFAVKDGLHVLQIQDLPAGTYTLKLFNDKQQYVQKIIII